MLGEMTANEEWYRSIRLRSFTKKRSLSSSATCNKLSMISRRCSNPIFVTSTSSCTTRLPRLFCKMVVRRRSYVGSFSSAAHFSASSSSSTLLQCRDRDRDGVALREKNMSEPTLTDRVDRVVLPAPLASP